VSPSFSSSPPPPPPSSPFRSSSSLSLYMFSGNPPRTGWKVGPRNVRFASFVLCMRQNSGPNFWYWNSLSLPAGWWECYCGRTTRCSLIAHTAEGNSRSCSHSGRTSGTQTSCACDGDGSFHCRLLFSWLVLTLCR
jgi:hypothetical protein